MRISDWSSDVCSSDLEESLFPRLGHDIDSAVAHGLHGRLREGFGVDIPLVGQPRLDHHAAAVAEGGLDRARFGVVLAAVLVDVRDQAKIGGASCRERVCQYG